MKNEFPEYEYIEEPIYQWQNVGGHNLLDYFYKNPKRWGFSFELYVMLTKINSLYNAAKSSKKIVILERSILSDKIFFEIAHESKNLSTMEYKMLLNTFDFYLEHLYPKINCIIYLETDVNICLERIKTRNRKEESKVEKSYILCLKNKLDYLIKFGKFNSMRIEGNFNLEKDLKEILGEIKKFIE